MERKGSRFPRNPVAPHLRDIPRSGIRDFFEIVSCRKDVISLGIGEPDFQTPWHIREAAIKSLEKGETAYTSNLGMAELREQIALYVKRSYGLKYDWKSEILVSVGVSEALDLAMRAILTPGAEVLYHEPSYVAYSPVIAMAHGKPVGVTTRREEGFRLTREMLEKKVTKKSRVLLLNFPTNPTGAVLTREDTQGIAKFAIKHNLMVITDEVYSELTYEGDRVSIASMPGMKDRTIFLSGLSKAWAMTGFRIGFACASPVLTEAMMKIHQYTMMCAGTTSQIAGVEALKNGDDDIRTMREEYKLRRNFICGALNDMGLDCHLPRGAFYVFPYIGGTGLKSKDFSLRLLDEENVACVPGTAFGPSGEGYVRCSYATHLDEIREATKRMASFLKRL